MVLPSKLVIATLVVSQIALGCARHLEVIDAGPAPEGVEAALLVDVQPTDDLRPDGLWVEVFHNGALLTRFTTSSDGPQHLPDLPPGEYVVRVDTRPIGGDVLEAQFGLARGRAFAVVYEDNELARRSAARTALEVARVTGIVLAVTVILAAEVALVVFSGGCYHPCVYGVVLGR